MPIQYEWDIETWEDDEIADHFHHNRLHDFPGEMLTMAVAEDGYRLVLVRDRYDDSGVICRSWAYVTDGKLPEDFLDAYDRPVAKVPKRFHKEFNL